MCPHHASTPAAPDAVPTPVAAVAASASGSDGPGATIVREEGAQLDFSRAMSYGDYLQLDAVLGAQKPLSPAHDELLFIVQHQTSELWMKLMLHELRAAIRCVAEDDLQRAFKMLARVSKIMEQLVHAWGVLATMTPPSGFQSWQYRSIEFALGNKNGLMLKPHEHRPDLLAEVQAAYATPSLYDEALRLLARRGIEVPAEALERDWTQPYTPSDGVEQAWLTACLMGSVPAGRRIDRPGRRLPALAFPACDHGGAGDRLQARAGWDVRRVVSAEDAGRGAVSGDLALADGAVRMLSAVPEGGGGRLASQARLSQCQPLTTGMSMP